MRKFLIMFALMVGVVSSNAQIATENSNALDNISVGVTAGVSTPLDFNSIFPVNPNVGIKLQKDFTPSVGLQVEGLAILNDNHFSDIKTSVKATNVSANGVFNLSNIFCGYRGTPRVFEVSAVGGLGWLHTWNTSINSLTAKTGLDIAFNFGRTKAHSIVLTPAVYWNLNKFNHIRFDKRGSQLALNLTYAYHFKTSNGTRHFKTYDVGAMMDEINRLNGALDECEKREPKVVTRVVERVVEKVIKVPQEQVTTNAVAVANKKSGKWIVPFETNSSDISQNAALVLNQIGQNMVVDVTATASPSGGEEYNKKLSERRAKAVADFLTKRGVKVRSAIGKGIDAEKGCSAIVTPAK